MELLILSRLQGIRDFWKFVSLNNLKISEFFFVKESNMILFFDDPVYFDLFKDRFDRYISGMFIKGKKEGIHTTFYPNGKKYSEGFYHNNEKEGTWTFWEQQGNSFSELHFETGEVVNGS